MNMRFAKPEDYVLVAAYLCKIRNGGSPQLWKLLDRETRSALEKRQLNQKLKQFIVESSKNKYNVNQFYLSNETVELAEKM